MSLSPGEPAAPPGGAQSAPGALHPPGAQPPSGTQLPGAQSPPGAHRPPGAATSPPVRPAGMFGGLGGLGGIGGMGRGSAADTGVVPRGRSRIPMRLVVGILCALIFFTTATRIAPAIRAGMHDGTRGEWVATNKKCVHSACVWQGKFVVADGHVLQTATEYDGQLPAVVHTGTAVSALDTGGSGTVFPANGSDLWISLLVALVLSALGLYWASHRYVAGYLRKRREQEPITAPRH
jgi:hypothetical protein